MSLLYASEPCTKFHIDKSMSSSSISSSLIFISSIKNLMNELKLLIYIINGYKNDDYKKSIICKKIDK